MARLITRRLFVDEVLTSVRFLNKCSDDPQDSRRLAPQIARMRKILIFAFLVGVVLPAHAADRELTLARQMLEDAVIRDDEEGMHLARERLLHIVAEADHRAVLRDSHFLVALSAFFESLSAYRDVGTSGRLAAMGIRHSDRAVEMDPQFADAWALSAALRRNAQRAGQAAAADPPGTPNRITLALELNSKSPLVALLNGTARAMNPAGPANPEGVQIIDDLVARLDADRASSLRPFGLWDAEAYAWKIMVRMAADDPRAEPLRPLAARLLEQRPDFALGHVIADSLADHRFVTEPAVVWQPFLTDPAGDGKNPKLSDVIAVDRAESGDRLWYRITVQEPLPRSFGTNIVVNRRGDPATGMLWWGTGSTFRFDRLVTAWISRDGDRYFGKVGVTDDDGARGLRFSKISSDVHLAVGGDGRTVMVGVPRAALDLTGKSTFVVAVGSHLVWNDDATSTPNSR